MNSILFACKLITADSVITYYYFVICYYIFYAYRLDMLWVGEDNNKGD